MIEIDRDGTHVTIRYQENEEDVPVATVDTGGNDAAQLRELYDVDAFSQGDYELVLEHAEDALAEQDGADYRFAGEITPLLAEQRTSRYKSREETER